MPSMYMSGVSVRGDVILVVAVEALGEVSLTVAIEIDELGQLIPAEHEQFTEAKLHAEWLKEPAGNATPPQRRGCLVHHAIDTPHIAIPHRDDGRFAIRREIKATGAHPAMKRIFQGQWEVVSDKVTVFLACHGFCRDGLWPLRRSTFGERREIHRLLKIRCERVKRAGITFGQEHSRLHLTNVVGHLQHPVALYFDELAIALHHHVHRLRCKAYIMRGDDIGDVDGADKDRRAAVVDPGR